MESLTQSTKLNICRMTTASLLIRPFIEGSHDPSRYTIERYCIYTKRYKPSNWLWSSCMCGPEEQQQVPERLCFFGRKTSICQRGQHSREGARYSTKYVITYCFPNYVETSDILALVVAVVVVVTEKEGGAPCTASVFSCQWAKNPHTSQEIQRS